MPVVSDAECRLAYGEEDMWDNMICAGYPEGGKDSCNVSLTINCGEVTTTCVRYCMTANIFQYNRQGYLQVMQ